MTDKAYIVTNEAQEREVLDKLYSKGKMWPSSDGKGNYWSPVHKYVEFPYVIADEGERLIWATIKGLTDEEIVYDGRKEGKMKISKEVYDALVEWRDAHHLYHTRIDGGDLLRLPTYILNFWLELGISQNEANIRLITIIRWLNGEDVFEIEKPKLWIVRSKDTDTHNKHNYIFTSIRDGLPFAYFVEYVENATKFETKEEAESWANSHQEVVEVEE